MSENEFTGIDHENPYKRLPIALCLDTSGSMHQDIADLNVAIQAFFTELKGHERAKNSVETVVVQFGNGTDDGVDVVSPFTEVEHAGVPTLSAGGSTPMGAAIERCLALLEERKQGYKDSSIDYYQPILVLMTDGGPTDSVDIAAGLLREQVSNNRLTVIPVAFGYDADRQTIENITGTKPITFTESIVFLEFFNWLSSSAAVPGNLPENIDEFLSDLGLD